MLSIEVEEKPPLLNEHSNRDACPYFNLGRLLRDINRLLPTLPYVFKTIHSIMGVSRYYGIKPIMLLYDLIEIVNSDEKSDCGRVNINELLAMTFFSAEKEYIAILELCLSALITVQEKRFFSSLYLIAASATNADVLSCLDVMEIPIPTDPAARRAFLRALYENRTISHSIYTKYYCKVQHYCKLFAVDAREITPDDILKNRIFQLYQDEDIEKLLDDFQRYFHQKRFDKIMNVLHAVENPSLINRIMLHLLGLTNIEVSAKQFLLTSLSFRIDSWFSFLEAITFISDDERQYLLLRNFMQSIQTNAGLINFLLIQAEYESSMIPEQKHSIKDSLLYRILAILCSVKSDFLLVDQRQKRFLLNAIDLIAMDADLSTAIRIKKNTRLCGTGT
ncbi:hypothetical protein [Coxiella burnetii]|nr:hypothetical protein [Coxiella burnetii]ACJ20998.1 hypothetical protein CbuK_1884 [Coxiella burnetii CbuK_Q154]ATN86592.1 hypothetical protein AYO29_09320 [Coxiella burnetii str. Schperling]EAX33492.1 hypothetical protein A35_09600 [Coxiella burnetii 'MSU Goat Q177']PHH56729.1 hypothetical protein CRH12_09355 [Coxiella burnetii]